MLTLVSILLLVNAAYNALVWPRFLSRIAADPRARDSAGRRTRFFTVHAILIGVALALAVVSAIAGIAGLISA